MEQEEKNVCLVFGLKGIANELLVSYTDNGWKVKGSKQLDAMEEIIKEIREVNNLTKK